MVQPERFRQNLREPPRRHLPQQRRARAEPRLGVQQRGEGQNLGVRIRKTDPVGQAAQVLEQGPLGRDPLLF